MRTKFVLNVLSIVLGLISALCLSYSTLHGFHGSEFANPTFDGSVPKTPEYVQFEKIKENFELAEVALIVISTALQIIAISINPRE
jgi:hypothetical protein